MVSLFCILDEPPIKGFSEPRFTFLCEEEQDQYGWREGKEESMEVLGDRERSQEARVKILDFILYVIR